MTPMRERPSPHALWKQAGGDRERYVALMKQHGHLVPAHPMRERLARALYEMYKSGANASHWVRFEDLGSDRSKWLRRADAILASLGPDVFLVDVETVARRLFQSSDPYRDDPEVWDRTLEWVRACYMARARRLLGGRE